MDKKIYNPIEIEKNFSELFAQEQFYSIALFDILGFSNYVNTHGSQAVSDLYDKLLEIIYQPDFMRPTPVPLTRDWKYNIYICDSNGYIKVCHFSDTFIVYVNYAFNREGFYLANNHYETYPLLLTEDETEFHSILYQKHPIYLAFLQTCMEFFCQSIVSGIPLRGCVASGHAIMDSNKSKYIGPPIVEAARAEPARKSLGISFGKSFNNYHPVYNDYFIPIYDFIKDNNPKSKFISPMILDWPRYWRNSKVYNKYSFYECIQKMNTNKEYSEYYDNTIKMFDFSVQHQNWANEIDRNGLKNISDYYKKTKKWYHSQKI